MNTSRMTTTDLVDMLGSIKAEKADLAARERRVKAALTSRMNRGTPTTTLEGRLFRVVVIQAVRRMLDTARIRELFAATGAQVPEKTSMQTRWDVSARVEEAA
jgi:hypothetical protein